MDFKIASSSAGSLQGYAAGNEGSIQSPGEAKILGSGNRWPVEGYICVEIFAYTVDDSNLIWGEG